jgi:RNA polymerase sigma-70 factor, ECF subfamily
MRQIALKYQSISDEDLMVSLAKGDHNAFNELYQRYAKIIMLFFKRNLWNDLEKAEDFVHDLFAKIIQKPESFDHARSFKTWFYSVANNMCKNEYKKQEIRKNTKHQLSEHVQIADNSQNVLNTVQDNEFSIAFYENIKKIDQKHREVFVLRHFDGLSIKEIATILNANEGTIKSRLFYATKQLASYLKEFQTIYTNE